MTSPDSKYPIREIFRLFLDDYWETHTLTTEQEKAAFSIRSCKTGELGYNISLCPDCGHQVIHACSCNNRNCPCCQYPLEQRWIEDRQSELIEDIEYYHVVFTVPCELNPLIAANPKLLLNLQFRCVSETLVELCADKRWLGAKPGIVSVLHTWGSKLNYHPHIHTIVTGGGLTKCGTFVRSRHKGYLIPEKVLAKKFRGKYLDNLKTLYAKEKLVIPAALENLQNHYEWQEYVDALYRKQWLPFLKETFNGNGNAIKYLARYAFRTAISNSRIVSVDEEHVTFRYTDYKNDGQKELMTMTGEEFLEAFLQHILPSGFHRVRFGGFLANSRKRKNLRLIHRLLNREYKEPPKDRSIRSLFLRLFGRDICKCPQCDGELNNAGRGIRLPHIRQPSMN